VAYCYNTSIYRHFQDITTFPVYATACDLQKSFTFDTHTHTKPFYGSLDLVRDNPGEPVPEETFTHSHSSWSSIIPI